MDFLNRLKETIPEIGNAATEKVQNAAEIVRLKSQIATCEDVIKKNYLEIGRLYYEHYGELAEGLFEKQCRAIKNATEGENELKKQLQEKKNHG